jgi:hypothetical protein
MVFFLVILILICNETFFKLDFKQQLFCSTLKSENFYFALEKPYLTGEQLLDSVETNISNITELTFDNMTDIYGNIGRRSNLKIPFLMSAIIQIIGLH